MILYKNIISRQAYLRCCFQNFFCFNFFEISAPSTSSLFFKVLLPIENQLLFSEEFLLTTSKNSVVNFAGSSFHEIFDGSLPKKIMTVVCLKMV